MTRIFTEGFEMGDGKQWDIRNASTVVLSDGFLPRSGRYGCIRDGGNTVGGKSLPNLSEAYFRFAVIGTPSGYYLFYFENVYNSNDLIRLDWRIGSPISLYINNTLVAEGNVIPAPNDWNLLEVYIKIADAGEVTVKYNGVLDFSFSGDTDPTGSSLMNSLRFYSGGAGIDDIAINDTSGLEDNSWCGDGHIIAIKPNANGDSSQLIGSDGDQVNNFEMVDETPSDNDGSYVWNDVIDTQDLYNLEPPNLPVNHKILRVWPEARAKDPDAGQIALPIKAGATQDDGPNIALLTEYSAVTGKDHKINPDTGLPWEEADLNSLQAGAKIKS